MLFPWHFFKNFVYAMQAPKIMQQLRWIDIKIK